MSKSSTVAAGGTVAATGPASSPTDATPMTNSGNAASVGLSTDGVAFNSGEDIVSRWGNYFNILTGRMSDQGKEDFRRIRDLRNEAADCKRCEDDRDYLLKYSPTIRFMRDNINQLGGDINSVNVRCRRCDRTQRQSGGFHPQYGILVCANELRNRGHLEDTMAHEMVHAYDHLRFKVDWSGEEDTETNTSKAGHNNIINRSLRHAACTEIRASSLSGECRFMREFATRGQWKLTQQHQECVRRRAVLSVLARPACGGSQEKAQEAVNSVWDNCFSDTRPFDEIYR